MCRQEHCTLGLKTNFHLVPTAVAKPYLTSYLTCFSCVATTKGFHSVLFIQVNSIITRPPIQLLRCCSQNDNIWRAILKECPLNMHVVLFIVSNNVTFCASGRNINSTTQGNSRISISYHGNVTPYFSTLTLPLTIGGWKKKETNRL